MIIPREHSIIISPPYDRDASYLKQVKEEISRIFHFRTEIIPLLNDVGFAHDPGRNQYNSTLILDKLANLAPHHSIKIIAIIRVDLFIPILTHVYGEAQIGGKACIVSTHRLMEGLSPMTIPEKYDQRIAKEAVHELGHTFGLRHCKDHTCIMHYCRTMSDVDRKSDQLCRYCKVLLEDEIKKMS